MSGCAIVELLWLFRFVLCAVCAISRSTFYNSGLIQSTNSFFGIVSFFFVWWFFLLFIKTSLRLCYRFCILFVSRVWVIRGFSWAALRFLVCVIICVFGLCFFHVCCVYFVLVWSSLFFHWPKAHVFFSRFFYGLVFIRCPSIAR